MQKIDNTKEWIATNGELVIHKGTDPSAITTRSWQQGMTKLGIVLDDAPYGPTQISCSNAAESIAVNAYFMRARVRFDPIERHHFIDADAHQTCCGRRSSMIDFRSAA